MNFRIPLLLFTLPLLFIGNGCEKRQNDRETITSDNHTLAEASFNNIFNHLVIAASPFGELLTDSCFTITSSGSSFPRTILVDFGSKGCTGILGVGIYGRISTTLSDSLNHKDAVMTATPLELYIKGYKVEGTVIITNTGVNASGNQTYQMTVTNGIITAEEETGESFSIPWECNYQYELFEKNNDIIPLDDLYHITGTASGQNEEGRSYTAEIIEALQKIVDCRWPGSGKTTIAPDDLTARDLNYGICEELNCCDNVAIEEIKLTDKTVRMR